MMTVRLCFQLAGIIIGSIVIADVMAQRDAQRKPVEINHSSNASLVMIAAAVMGTLTANMAALLLVPALHWLSFDLLLNKYRGLKPCYRPKIGSYSAVTDKILARVHHSCVWQLILKGLLIIAAALIYIYVFHFQIKGA